MLNSPNMDPLLSPGRLTGCCYACRAFISCMAYSQLTITVAVPNSPGKDMIEDTTLLIEYRISFLFGEIWWNVSVLMVTVSSRLTIPQSTGHKGSLTGRLTVARHFKWDTLCCFFLFICHPSATLWALNCCILTAHTGYTVGCGSCIELLVSHFTPLVCI